MFHHSGHICQSQHLSTELRNSISIHTLTIGDTITGCSATRREARPAKIALDILNADPIKIAGCRNGSTAPSSVLSQIAAMTKPTEALHVATNIYRSLRA